MYLYVKYKRVSCVYDLQLFYFILSYLFFIQINMNLIHIESKFPKVIMDIYTTVQKFGVRNIVFKSFLKKSFLPINAAFI